MPGPQQVVHAWIGPDRGYGFGFTIYKFLQVVQQGNPGAVPNLNAPRNLGLALIGIGTFALIGASIE